jgi:hypothetical protein
VLEARGQRRLEGRAVPHLRTALALVGIHLADIETVLGRGVSERTALRGESDAAFCLRRSADSNVPRERWRPGSDD